MRRASKDTYTSTYLLSIPGSSQVSATMKLKEIHRTSTFAWAPSFPIPLLATGTVAGALDESFSNDSQLEIWGPDFLDKNEYALGGDAGQPGPKASVVTTSRYVFDYRTARLLNAAQIQPHSMGICRQCQTSRCPRSRHGKWRAWYMGSRKNT